MIRTLVSVTDVGAARVEITGDVRQFARQAEQDLDRALAKIELDPVKIDVDAEGIRKSGEQAGASLGDGITRGADGRLRDSRGKFVAMGRDAGKAAGEGVNQGAKDSLGKGKFSNFLKEAFTPHPGMFAALRAPFAAALSTPIGAAVVTVAGTAALAFVGAFAAALATAGLGAVFLGIGAAALFGAKQSRDEAQKDLDAAEERVRKAQQRAQSGTAAAKRSLADARAELAKAQAAVEDNAAFTKLDGSLRKLGDTLKNVGKSAAAPLIGPFTDAINSLADKAVALTPLLHNIFSGLAPAIGPLTEGMAGFVEEFLKVLNEDPATIEAMKDALIALGQNLPRLGAALGEIFALFASNDNNVRNIGLLFGLIEMTMFNLASTIFGLSKVLDGLVIAWNAIRDAGAATIDWITGTAIPAITGAASAVGAFFQSIPGIISSAWSAITGFFSNAFTTISGFISNLVTSIVGFFTALPGRIIAALTALPGQLAAFFSNMVSNIAFMIGFGIGTVVSFFINLPGRIMAAIQAIPGLVASVFTTVWNTARSIVSAGINAVVNFFAQLPGRARTAISSIVSIVSSVLSAARSAAVSQASSLVAGAINIIRTLPGKISSALSSVRSAVTRAFAGAGSWLVSAGANIIAGIRNGIASAIGGAVAAARNAAQRIVDGFKSALKIGSPSKVMDVEVGRWIPAGVAQGIKRDTRLVNDQIKAMMGPDLMRDLPTFTLPAGRPRGGDGASAGTVVQVTIEPGAVQISGQGAQAGEEAAEALLERLGQAVLVR